MVLSLTSMQSSRLLHFGFWILDFGLKPAFFVVRIQSKIQNPKSKMPSRLRGQCRLRTGFLYIRSSKIVRCLLFVAFVASSLVRHQETTNHEQRTSKHSCYPYLPACRIRIQQHLYVINFSQIFLCQHVGCRSACEYLSVFQ